MYFVHAPWPFQVVVCVYVPNVPKGFQGFRRRVALTDLVYTMHTSFFFSFFLRTVSMYYCTQLREGGAAFERAGLRPAARRTRPARRRLSHFATLIEQSDLYLVGSTLTTEAVW